MKKFFRNFFNKISSTFEKTKHISNDINDSEIDNTDNPVINKNQMIENENKIKVEVSIEQNSDNDYQQSREEFHKNKIKLFDYTKIDKVVLDRDLTALEKSFLKYIEGSVADNINLAMYWTYDYGIDYKQTIDLFVSNNYLKISDYQTDLKKYTIPELKKLLKHYNLKLSGNKPDLLKRISDNLTTENLLDFFKDGPKYLELTEKGKVAISNLQESATKDPDFEDLIISYIQSKNLDKAYQIIGNRYGNHYDKELNFETENSYKKLFPRKITGNVSLDNLVVSILIFIDMMGIGGSRSHLILKRYLNPEYDLNFCKGLMHNFSKKYNHEKMLSQNKKLYEYGKTHKMEDSWFSKEEFEASNKELEETIEDCDENLKNIVKSNPQILENKLLLSNL